MTTPYPGTTLPDSQTQVVPGGAPNSPSVPNVTINNPPPPGQYFTAEQLEAARTQEKDKLYAQQEALKEQVNNFKAELATYKQEREVAETAARQAAEEAQRIKTQAEEEKLSVKQLLDKRDAEWKAQQEELKRQLELERAVMQKDQEHFRLQNFIQRRINEEISANTIIPDLIEYVDGNTETEVEASITKAKEKTANIVEGRARMLSQTPQIITPGVSPTGFASTGPLDNLTGTRQYSAQDIYNMNAAEYAEFRVQAGIDKAGNNKGLLG